MGLFPRGAPGYAPSVIRLVYFAWVRERIGQSGEEYPLAEPVHVAALLDALAERGGGYAHALHDRTTLRFAVNQAVVGADTLVKPGDEVAIFPPVTGG